jgi:hypothetical protein
MPTLVNDPQPVELTALIERRRQLGQVHWLGLSGREY